MGILYFVRVDDIYMLIGEFQSNKKLRKKIAGGLVKSWIITTFAGRLYPKRNASERAACFLAGHRCV